MSVAAAGGDALFVETEAYLRLCELIDSNTTPIFLAGQAGTGKTATIYAIARRAETTNRKVFLCHLAAVSRESDIVAALRQNLSTNTGDQALAIRSSSDNVVRAAVRI